MSINCAVCGTALCGEAHDDNEILAALVGVSNDPYATCPQCKSEIVDEATYFDQDFRRRVRMFLFERHNIVVREPAPQSHRRSGWYQRASVRYNSIGSPMRQGRKPKKADSSAEECAQAAIYKPKMKRRPK